MLAKYRKDLKKKKNDPRGYWYLDRQIGKNIIKINRKKIYLDSQVKPNNSKGLTK